MTEGQVPEVSPPPGSGAVAVSWLLVQPAAKRQAQITAISATGRNRESAGLVHMGELRSVIVGEDKANPVPCWASKSPDSLPHLREQGFAFRRMGQDQDNPVASLSLYGLTTGVPFGGQKG